MIKNIVFDLGGVIMHLDTDRAVKRFIEIGVSDATEFVNAYHCLLYTSPSPRD